MWRCFCDAVTAHERGSFDGIGFVFAADDPFAGIDLDHVRDPQAGTVEPWARDLVKRLDSYAELSQSGTGAHVIVRAKVPGDRRRKGIGANGQGVEMYDSGRYFCMTGQRLAGTPDTVEERQAVLNQVHAELFGAGDAVPSAQKADASPAAKTVSTPLSLNDAEIIEKARGAKNGQKFSALWDGRWQDAGCGSQSEADAALCSVLAFWTQDELQLDRLFRASGLMRKKWDRPDYRQATVALALENRTETYTPPVPARFKSCSVASEYLPPHGAAATEVEIEPVVAYRPFPVDALPEPHRSLVIHGAEAIGCDHALVALPLLATTAGGIGNARRIMLKRGWCEPSVLWAVSVALSGDRKSPAFELGIDGLQQIEERAFAEYRAALDEHKLDLQRWKEAGASGAKPESPTARRLIIRDVTVQSAALVLSGNPRGVTLARDEMAAWVGGFDRFTAGKGEEVAHWLEMHRAGKVTVDRKTGDVKTVHVPRAAVSITGTIQPATLGRLLDRRHFENGLAARLLLAWPPRQLRTWNEGEVDEAILKPVRTVFERLTSLPMGADGFGNPQPIDLPLTPEAKLRWIRFFDEHAEEAHSLGDERLASAWSKLEGSTARFALIFHSIRAASGDNSLRDSAAVDHQSIEAAIQLTNWFKEETRRIYGRLAESENARDTRKILECVQAKGGRVTVRDVVKVGLCRGDAERITAIFTSLTEAGVGAWRDVPPTEKGGRGTRAFELTRETGETPKIGSPGAATPPAKPAKPAKPQSASEVSPETPVSRVGSQDKIEQGTL